ncbi:MAG: hypothetical protein EHM55_21550 [Acidobacteria bacterium]|nr:MAG: hypothetical protein EHM55_21550 [Acidobacteriota bacterium]
MAATVAVSPIYAQEEPPGAPVQPVPVLRGIVLSSDITFAPHIAAPPMPVRQMTSASAASLAMYGAYGMLQVLDAHSTRRAIANNGVEANPIVRPLASSRIGLISLKVASGAGVMYLMERVRKKHPAAALALAIGINSLQAVVVVHNYRVARR